MAISGQKTVASSATAEALGSQLINGALMVKALTTNTGLAYVGNASGNVSSSTGMPLAAGDVVVFPTVGNLASLYVAVAVNGEGVAWIALEI